MKSFVTSYNGLFSRRETDTTPVARIEIPLIQRDYAQGRDGEAARRIRNSFLGVLHCALTGGERVSLDFVYGDVKDGTLSPLDGQQRLTTLFLLHWYLACRAGRLAQEQGWKKFTYATRPSARLFCERLTVCDLPSDIERPSSWIVDQPWYLYTWQHDPTIQSMLVVVDAIHQRFHSDDHRAAWERLVDPEKPAITFHLLPMGQMGLTDDLYIKMNSRGKPLTPFENFKARFEQVLETSCPGRVAAFADKIDGVWSDVLWPYHGGDYLIDVELLRYFRFATEVSEWRMGRHAMGEITSLAERVYGPENADVAAQVEFLFRVFDTWIGVLIPRYFDSLFVRADAPVVAGNPNIVPLFGLPASASVDLFAACCASYGEDRGNTRVFSLQQTLLLYAVLLHRLNDTPDFARRLRVLRNLTEASVNELRLERMPALVRDVEQIIIKGSLEGVAAFNLAQVADERLKAELLLRHTDLQSVLFELEDHPLLRGCIAAFELDPAVFAQRAEAFRALFSGRRDWGSLTGGLLATGDYSRRLKGRSFQFGSSDSRAPWRELLTNAGRAHSTGVREVLGRLLDRVAQHHGDPPSCLAALQQEWLEASERGGALSWRYYFVKYEAMRVGQSGIYVGSAGRLSYEVCMLDKRQMNSWYRDPYLLAIFRQSGVAASIEEPWFKGHETEPRWMALKNSGTALRCVERGILLRPPAASSWSETFLKVCVAHGIGEDYLLPVPQVQQQGVLIDTRDRVQLGAAFLRELVAAGL